jgi:hypothetical protein
VQDVAAVKRYVKAADPAASEIANQQAQPLRVGLCGVSEM